MMDDVSMSAPEKVTIGIKHTKNTTDTTSKNNFDKEERGEIVDYEGYDDQVKGGEIVYNRSTSAPLQVTIGAHHTQNTTDTPFNKNCDQ